MLISTSTLASRAIDDELAIECIAAEIQADAGTRVVGGFFRRRGLAISRPKMSMEEATVEARLYWRNELDHEERSDFLVHLQENIAALSAQGNERSFQDTIESLGLFDAAFLLAAIVSAYGTGSGALREHGTPDEVTSGAERRLPYWLRESGASEKSAPEAKQKWITEGESDVPVEW